MPLLFVPAIRDWPEPTSWTDTRTPGIASLDSPVTVPVIAPPATCARTEWGVARIASRHKAAAIRITDEVLIGRLLQENLRNEMKRVYMRPHQNAGNGRHPAGRSLPSLFHFLNYLEDVMVPAARSLRTTAPPFITNFTRCISVMSVSGSPATAIRSANLPFSMLPSTSCL